MPKSRQKSGRRGQQRRRDRTRISRMVTRRLEDAQTLVDSIRAHKAAVAAACRERLAPALREGETLPDHELDLELRARTVEAAIDRLVGLDDRRDFARSARGLAARAVNRRAKELYPEAVDVRREIDVAFGRKIGAELHAFRGQTTRTPGHLMRHVERLLLRLQDPHRVLPTETVRGGPDRRETWIERLAKPYQKLEVAERRLRECASLLRNLELDREQAMKEYDALYGGTLKLVEAELREAGLGERVLENLRPYYRRRRLQRQARKKREIRARRQGAAAVPIEAVKAAPEDRAPPPQAPPEREAPPAEGGGSLSQGAVATVSRWLKKSRVLG